MKLSVIIPVYNDVNSLKVAIQKSIEELSQLAIPFEIIIVEDASTDGSYEIALESSYRDHRIHLNHSDIRRGKGGALMDGICQARGSIIIFYDVDLSTDLSSLKNMIILIQSCDIVVGSRMLKESKVDRSGKRDISSKSFNFLVRTLLGSTIQDHQCGFKAFNKTTLDKLLPYVHSRGWMWDTETLVVAQKCHCSIVEIPVIWKEGKDTKLRIRDIFAMALSLIRFTWKIRIKRDYYKCN
ncbi:MAG TPA: glycosyltransferase [Methanocorpusculum sp.]|nr:glycosyltransferase [Methanocorpusculum sp.]HJK79916.1 glycosyltransferase [Methanocorpusculum sp.]